MLEIIRKVVFIRLVFLYWFVSLFWVFFFFVLICFGFYKMRLIFKNILYFILSGYFINNIVINVWFLLMYILISCLF